MRWTLFISFIGALSALRILHWKCKFSKVCHFNLFCLSPVQLLSHLTLASTVATLFHSHRIDDFGNGSANNIADSIPRSFARRCDSDSLYIFLLSFTPFLCIGFIHVYFRLMGKSHKFICFGTFEGNTKAKRKKQQHPKINHRDWALFFSSFLLLLVKHIHVAALGRHLMEHEEALLSMYVTNKLDWWNFSFAVVLIENKMIQLWIVFSVCLFGFAFGKCIGRQTHIENYINFPFASFPAEEQRKKTWFAFTYLLYFCMLNVE